MYDTNMKSIGNKIRSYRNAKNISTQKLGNAIGKDKTTISRYENGEIIMDMLTVIELCNALNIDMNDICEMIVKDTEQNKNENPFHTNLLYLYYISKNGIVISSIEIEEKKYANYIIMKNGLKGNQYKQEYTGILESNYNTAFICLTNAINNPGLDKFQIEIDLHSKTNDIYYGLFLGISDNTHKPTARKCILTTNLIASKDKLNEVFESLEVTEEEANDIVKTKYWDLKCSRITDYIINL